MWGGGQLRVVEEEDVKGSCDDTSLRNIWCDWEADLSTPHAVCLLS